MNTVDADTLFAQAARSAAHFRHSLPDRLQRPLRDFREELASFKEPLPEAPQDAEAVIAKLVELAEPGLHAMAGPRFFGWVIGNSHPVGVAADMLTSAWGQNAGNHTAAPAAAAAETVASAWLLELFGLPRDASVGFVTGATLANFTCLAAARGEVLRLAGWDADGQGLFGAPPITVLIGDDAHTTVFAALQFLGLGHDRVVRLETDKQGCVRPDTFAAAIAKVEGPCIVVLQAGQINTGAMDPFAECIPLARARQAWVHVDGAFGLWSRASPALAGMAEGIELADSWATDGHKWLQTPYDCGYAIVRNEQAHRKAMTIAASYLPTAAPGERDPAHYVPELSRRARGFPTWAMIKHLGRSGIIDMIDRHCRVARLMAGRLAREPGIAILNDVVLNQIIVRFGSGEAPETADRLTRETIARIQKDGECFAGGALWRGQQVMRISVTGFSTDEAEGQRSAGAMIRAWQVVRQAG